MRSGSSNRATQYLVAVLAMALLPVFAAADQRKPTTKQPKQPAPPPPTVEAPRRGNARPSDARRSPAPRYTGSPQRTGAIRIREPRDKVVVSRPTRPIFGRPAPRVYRPVRYGTVYRKIPEQRPVVVRDTRFYVNDGCYYVRHPSVSRYIAVRPPVGVVVSALPADYLVVGLGNLTFYYYDDTWYDTSLRVVEVPVGGFIYELPPVYRTVVVDRATYYEVGNIYYRPIFREGRTAYERVDVDVDIDDDGIEVDVDAERDSRGFRFSDFRFDLDIDIDD
jgi:hypothetical protein